ncbi:MAG: T9SS type A sorting domain-containing protein, partial [Bacteroidota bacterium]
SYRVYPNPSTGAFTVDFDLSQNISEARLDIRNHLGQSIYQEQINVLSGKNIKSLSVDLPQGVYYVSLSRGSSSITKPIYILR